MFSDSNLSNIHLNLFIIQVPNSFVHCISHECYLCVYFVLIRLALGLTLALQMTIDWARYESISNCK